jgi:acyl dehydratase
MQPGRQGRSGRLAIETRVVEAPGRAHLREPGARKRVGEDLDDVGLRLAEDEVRQTRPVEPDDDLRASEQLRLLLEAKRLRTERLEPMRLQDLDSFTNGRVDCRRRLI